jgi:TRAP-type C4-dicarboxylate transport system permease small subunit
MKKIIFFILLFSPSFAFAWCTITSNTSPDEAISCIYQTIVVVSGILALLMIVIGGFQWLTSAGNEQAIKGAKEKIFSAILGLVIVLMSYVILVNFIGLLAP